MRYIKIKLADKYDFLLYTRKLVVVKYNPKQKCAAGASASTNYIEDFFTHHPLSSDELDAITKIQIAVLNFLNIRRVLRREEAAILIQNKFRYRFKRMFSSV